MSQPAPDQSDPRDLGAAQPLTVTTRTATADAPTVVRSGRRRRVRRRSVLGDMTAGLLLGDFANDLGLPGAVTQVVISFVPLLGTTCAVRDLVADLRHHDRVGAALNFLALTPVLGGFSKTFEVIRSTAHIGHVMHISHEQAQRSKTDAQAVSANDSQGADQSESQRRA